MKPIENVDHVARDDLAQACDRNFRLLAREDTICVITHSFTIKSTDQIDSVQADATAGAVIVTLPTPNGQRRYRLIKTDVSGNTVTLSAGGTIFINGATVFALAIQYKYVWVESTGTKWLIIGSN